MSTRDNYEATPTPIEDLKDGQAVITSTGAEGTVVHYGPTEGRTYRLHLDSLGEEYVIRSKVIEALNLELYKQLEPKDYVIVWSGGLTLAKPQTFSEAQAELKRSWDTGEIFRLVPLDVAGEEQ